MNKITKAIIICVIGLLFFVLVNLGIAIAESHNICNAMNLSGCLK